MQGVSTVELILALVLLVSVVGSTMYYLRSVLPGLEARALASYTFETAALGPALVGARIGHPEALPSDPLSATPRILGPLTYFSEFPGNIEGVVAFKDEAEGLIRLLSVTAAGATESAESWCLTLIDPWQAPLSDSCRINASHAVPGRDEIGPSGQCTFSPEILGCLAKSSEPFLRAHGCKTGTAPGLRPLLIGLYPIDSSAAFEDGCAVRAVDVARTYDIRHAPTGGP